MTDSLDLKTEDVAWLEAAKDAGSSPYCLEHNARIDRILSALTPAAREPGEIRISVAFRDDGGLRVWSDDEPGLILSGEDPVRVAGCIPVAIQALQEHRKSPPPHREGVG